MKRIGVLADDPLVSEGLRRLFARQPGVQAFPLAPAAEPGPDCDVIVVDVWPPTPGHAEAICAHCRQQHPEAAIVAVVHDPSPALLARVRRSGGTALWPKDDIRSLPRFALELSEHPSESVH